MKQARRGFTLIELLVVIGIIMILIALLVLGFRHLNAVAAHKETVTELHLCNNLLVDYESHNGLKSIETTDNQVKDPSAVLPGMFPVYQDTSATNRQSIPLSKITGDMSDKGSSSSLRYSSEAVQKTQNVLQILMLIPSNRNVVSTLPPKRTLETFTGTNATTLNQGTVVLDGWGNPIIFVPAGGLHVNIIPDPSTTNKVDYIVRSTGMFPASDIAKHPITAADRPFWASAGQDGDFSIGEDNIYSFQD